MATNNYIQIQIISRDMDILYSGGITSKVSNLGKLTAKTGIDLTASTNANYANLPNAGNNETWYGVKFGSSLYYTQTGYVPFGVQNLQLSVAQTGMKFVIDLVHTETNSDSNNYESNPLLRTISGYGKFIYSPFNAVINGWVSVDENNVIKVYIDSANTTYFDQLTSAYRNQVFIQVIGHWEIATSNYNISNITVNCTSTNPQTTIESGETYENTFIPNNGYDFNVNNIIWATMNNNRYDGVLDANGNIVLTIPNVTGDIEILGGAITKYQISLDLYNCKLFNNETLFFRAGSYQTANKLLETNTYNILYIEGSSYSKRLHETEFKIINIFDANNNQIDIPNDTYLIVVNGILRLYWTGSNTYANRIEIAYNYLDEYVLDTETYRFTLLSNDGFIFKTFPTWVMGSSNGQFALFPNDKTKAEIRWNLHPYITIDNNLSIQANATLSASLKYGFVSIYNPTYDEVDELSKKRFYSVTQSEMLDLSQYIISFRKLYVDIPQIARELVYFGKYNTNVSSNIITTNFVETDCGTITIDEYNENSLDYNGVEIELYLPFVGSVSLNANQVYGKQLHLVYRTNPLNGDCVAILFSNNIQISYSQGNVSFDVPINFKYGNLNNYGTNDNALYMAELQPYIEIKTNRQYQNMNSRLLNNNLWVQISDCSGYVMFSDIEFHPINKINKDEYDEIITLLQSGIIV